MDRDNELEEEYKTTNYKEFIRQEIESRRVSGEWYLYEREGRSPWIGQITDFNSLLIFDWTITPVDIFKKE